MRIPGSSPQRGAGAPVTVASLSLQYFDAFSVPVRGPGFRAWLLRRAKGGSTVAAVPKNIIIAIVAALRRLAREAVVAVLD